MESKQDVVIQAIIDSITDTGKTTITGNYWFRFDEDEISTVYLELICLLVSAVDFTSFVAIKSNQRQRIAFMDSFNEELENHDSWLPAQIASKFDTILDSRISAYGQIIKTYDDYDLRIAQYFAKLFDQEDDHEMIQIIRLVFIRHVDKAKQILANHFTTT